MEEYRKDDRSKILTKEPYFNFTYLAKEILGLNDEEIKELENNWNKNKDK